MEGMDWEEAFESTHMGGRSSVPAGDWTQDDAQAIVESSSYPSDTITPGNEAGRPHHRRDSLLDGRDGKQINSLDIGGGSGPIVACSVNHQSHRSGECASSPSLWAQPVLPFPALLDRESQLPSSSGGPTGRARGGILDHYGGRQNVRHLRSSELEGVKHKIFVSHSGSQKDFAEQLCVDLERGGFVSPFFDQREHSLPKGKDFAPLIKEAARHCHVAAIVLSEEYLRSKWPMIELAEFHGAQGAENPQLNMLPLFYKLSVEDLDEKAVEERWMPRWRELANEDERIDVAEWVVAVRALRKANGLVFGRKGPSEVGYRKDIVRSIFKLSCADLMYGSSRSMVGYSRICEAVCDRFVRRTTGGPSVLGLYGTSGAGKTTLSKALCDHFCGEYKGRVCHVDLGETPRMGWGCPGDLNETSRLRWAQVERVKRVLERLCGFDGDVLHRITDFEQGLTEMRLHMKREPVFLAIDNVTNDSSSWKEAHEYLEAGFHPESRIVITSRSIVNVRDLVPDIQFCMRMPRLRAVEAGELFLRSAAPSKSIFGLTAEEGRIVGLCIQQCLFSEADQDQVSWNSDAWERSYHPMALSALGDFFRRYFSKGDMLRWTDHLQENADPLLDLWRLPGGINGIIGLQFHSLPPSERLLFLDVATFSSNFRLGSFFLIYEFRSIVDEIDNKYFFWHCKVHDETWPVMERRLQDLERSGMIIYVTGHGGYRPPCITTHGIYRSFAEWYVTNHGMKWLKNAWCVFKTQGSVRNENYVASDLVRLRLIDLTRASARLLGSKRMQELHNLEVLQLHSCPYLTELNLEGLESLRSLELKRLPDLVSVILTRSSGMAESGGIFESLQIVVLDQLDSLVHVPDVRSCTSLHQYFVFDCPSMMNFEAMECPHLKVLVIRGLLAHQLRRLPNVTALHSLERFLLGIRGHFTLSDVEASRELRLRDLGRPYLKVVEELLIYLRTEQVGDDPYTNYGTIISWHKRNPHFEYLAWEECCGRVFKW